MGPIRSQENVLEMRVLYTRLDWGVSYLTRVCVWPNFVAEMVSGRNNPNAPGIALRAEVQKSNDLVGYLINMDIVVLVRCIVNLVLGGCDWEGGGSGGLLAQRH